MPPEQSLRHRVHRVIVRSVGESCTFFDEVVYRWHPEWMRQMMLLASTNELTAAARVTLPPSGFTGRMPEFEEQDLGDIG